MSDFESLLSAIPNDPNVAFILADYLEEKGDPRCELLRLSYTLKDIIEVTPERLAMEERLRELVLVEKLEPVMPRYTNEIGMEFVWIPPGKFLMGSPEDEPERRDVELQHEVTLTKGFWLQTTAVTQKQWEQVMGNNPSEFRGPELPVECVSWDDCQEFCQKLTERTDRPIVLPTEAQWEYACRSGTTTPFWFGNTITTDQANYHGEYPYAGGETGEFRNRTVVVKSFPGNGWGLYEMHGNVWELCQDWYGAYAGGLRIDPTGPTQSRSRVFRGGSWDYNAGRCRSAIRRRVYPVVSYGRLGFRCAQVPVPSK
ncbi:MAG: formylglycine-generating enzyme family protein [Gemmataceae bacterium]